MSEAASPLDDFQSASKRIVKHALDLGENRFQLFLLEVEEERERLFLALLLALSMAVFGLLTGVGFTVVVLMVFWNHHPLTAVSILTLVYAGAALFFYLRLVKLRSDWKAFSASLDQLRKDRLCLGELLHH